MDMDRDGKAEAPAAAPPAKRGMHLLFLFAGVLLPAFTLGFECVTHLSGQSTVDPIPGVWHILLIASVPLSNLLTWLALLRGAVSRSRQLIRLNAFAMGVALFYTLIYLPIMPLAVVGIAFFGMGLLPLAPFLSLIACIRGRMLLKAMPAGHGLPGPPGILGGLALGIAALLLPGLPATATHIGLRMAVSEAKETQASGIRWLRTLGDEDLMLRLCYARAPKFPDLIGLLVSKSEPITPEQARSAYYRVTGTAFNDKPAPAAERRREGFFDRDRGGEAVGNKVAGVSLSSSRLDGRVDADAATAYLEWTMVFRNDSAQEQEGRASIALPPGAAVSRLTLWIDGEEREAAFGGRSQVRQAYGKVVRAQRDPALVTTAGKGRVLLQLFPIPRGGGEMKVRIGMTAPLLLDDLGQARLQLPSFRERNFETASGLAHAVWLESRAPLKGGPLFEERIVGARSFALRADLRDADLGVPDALVTALRDPSVREVWSDDRRAEEAAAVVVQRYRERPAWKPKRVAVVIDASRSLGEMKEQIAESLAQLPPHLEHRVFLATDVPRQLSGSGDAAWRDRLVFEGGQDNLDALAMAWDWAAGEADGAIVWIHGPQPVRLSSADALLQRYERQPGRVRLYAVEAVPGANWLLPVLETIREPVVLPRFGGLRQDLERLFRQWQPGGVELAVERERLLSDAGRWPPDRKASAHLVRLWAADEIDRRVAESGADGRQAAVALARRYQLVTPISGAVVLESARQYADAGLEPAAPGSVPTVPEPEEWMLIAAVICLLAWQCRRMRQVGSAILTGAA